MTTATRTRRRAEQPETSTYVSGWHHGGQDARCVGSYAGTVCTHPMHTATAPGVDVNAGPEVPAKDTPKAAISPAGVPASRPGFEPLVLEVTVEDVSRDVARWLDTAEEIEALDALATVRKARQDLAQIEATIEARAAQLMSGNTVEWPGGVAERRFGKDRKEWQHDELVRQVANLVALDAATDKQSGETDDMLAALIQDAVAQFAATHRPDWRVTVLKKLGIDPDEFCHAIPGRTTIQITTAGPQ